MGHHARGMADVSALGSHFVALKGALAKDICRRECCGQSLSYLHHWVVVNRSETLPTMIFGGNVVRWDGFALLFKLSG